MSLILDGSKVSFGVGTRVLNFFFQMASHLFQLIGFMYFIILNFIVNTIILYFRSTHVASNVNYIVLATSILQNTSLNC